MKTHTGSARTTTVVIIGVIIIVLAIFAITRKTTSDSSAVVSDHASATTSVSQTVSDTSASTTTSQLSARPGWKRYTDPEYGFTFEYPSSWNIETGFVKSDAGTSHIVSVASDASRKLPIQERQEIFSIRVTTASSTALGGSVEYSAERAGFVSTSNAMTCVSPAYKVGAAVVDTKVPIYQLMRAHTGEGIRTEDAMLTNKKTLVQLSNVSAYPGNRDIVGVLSSFGFVGDTKAVTANCAPATTIVAPPNQNLIIQVTSPVTGTTWDSNTTHVVTWRTGSSPVKGSVGLFLVNRVNRRECLLGTAAAEAQSLTVNVTARQICAQSGGLTLQPGEYDFYVRYPQNLMDPFATTTGALYGNPANMPIHIEIAE